MNTSMERRRAECDLAVIECQHQVAAERLQQAATHLANVELAMTLAKTRVKRVRRRSRPGRRPFAWIESWFFLTPAIVTACVILWGTAQGWFA